MGKVNQKRDALVQYLDIASKKTLRDLILMITESEPDLRRDCMCILKKSAAKKVSKQTEDEKIDLLWLEICNDIDELEEYGGGDYDTVDYVSEILMEICEILNTKRVSSLCRDKLIGEALIYIESGNSGQVDELYDLAYASCYTNLDLHRLAQDFEAMTCEWAVRNARETYRSIGDYDKYLELRLAKMENGSDYHDLATFYYEIGKIEEAIQIGETGLEKGKGCLDELDLFLADRAKESKNRKRYLELMFLYTMKQLSLVKYKDFQELCTGNEWQEYEETILNRLNEFPEIEQLKICLHRQDYTETLNILMLDKFPYRNMVDSVHVQAAKQLETMYPEEVLRYYCLCLGNCDFTSDRKEYSRRVAILNMIRQLLIKIIKDKPRWLKFARKIKQMNSRRPAFLSELSCGIPGWKNI